MNAGSKTLMGVFGTTDFLVPMTVKGVSDAEARTRARGEEGPSIAWTIGHLLHYRVYMQGLLGAERDNPYAAAYGERGASDGADYPPLSEMLADWAREAEAFRAALTAASEADLDAPVGGGPHDEESVRDKLTFFAWHEGYHLGAIGALLKQLGHAGPAERVMAAREG